MFNWLCIDLNYYCPCRVIILWSAPFNRQLVILQLLSSFEVYMRMAGLVILFIFLNLTDRSPRLMALKIVSEIWLVVVWTRNGYEKFLSFCWLSSSVCFIHSLTHSPNTFNNIRSVFLSMYARVTRNVQFHAKNTNSNHWQWSGLSFVLSWDVIWLSPALNGHFLKSM